MTLFPLEITIPRVPPSANELKRKYRNPHVYKRLREMWEQEIMVAIRPEIRNRIRGFIHKTDPPAKMRLVVRCFRKRLLDTDNLYASLKPVLDSMVSLNLLHDDSEKFLSLEVSQDTTGKGLKPKTILTLCPGFWGVDHIDTTADVTLRVTTELLESSEE